MKDGLWIIDPDTGEDIYLTYDELGSDLRPDLIRPVGGFVFPASDFLAYENFGSVQFYVKDWLPKQGKAILYAPAKSGKSYLAMQLAQKLGLGDPFLSQPTLKSRVLYIQFELGESVLRQRMLSTGQSYENVFVGTSFSIKLDLESGQRQIQAAMEATQPDVLILDPLYKAIIGDENESQDIRRVMDFLDSLIDAYRCSIVLIHHSGKDTSRRGRGSSVLEDWPDSYIAVTANKREAGQPLTVKFRPIFLRHAPLPEEPLDLTLSEHFEFELPAEHIGTVKDQVLAFALAIKEPFSPAQLFDAGIGSNTSVYEKLEELITEGKIQKIRRGEYRAKI